jgi:tetratricopeptide (TPR) repeat protein
MDVRRAHNRSGRTARTACGGTLLVCLAAGCATAAAPNWWPWKKSEATPAAEASPSAPQDNFILRGLGLTSDFKGDDRALADELEGAKRLYQNKEYAKAEVICHRIANLRKGPLHIMDEALYVEADCQRLQNNFRDAEGTYLKYLKEFRNQGQFTDQVLRRLFDIANYWLDDTRKLMQAYEEKRDGKRWLVTPASYFHVSSDKPFFDAEGHALRILEEIRLNDIRGPLGERALFYIATVKFFREDYRDADYYYAQLFESYPNSQLAPKAIKQSIICKQIMHGGTDYDTRSVEESRKLIDSYQNAYPEWSKDRDWLTRQLSGIHLQQADRDFKVGEFYRRTGHPGSAYFYYELVRRRYPGTEYASKAEERMSELRGIANQDKIATAKIGGNVAGGSPMGGSPMGGSPMGGSPMDGNAGGGNRMGGNAVGDNGMGNAFGAPPPPAPPANAFTPLAPPSSSFPAPAPFAPGFAAPPVSPAAPAPLLPSLVPAPQPLNPSEPPAPVPIAPSQTPGASPSPRLLPPNFGPR